LSARLRDPYFQAAIGVIEKASPEQIAKLRQAHEKFAAARLEERLLGRSKALYVDAAKLFRQAGSPYALAAEATSYGELPELDRIARQARAAGYATLVARAEWLRAWNLAQGGEYLRALDLYEKVRSYYSTVHDVENGLAVQTRHAGVLTSTGQFEMGLGELLAIAPRQNAILQTRELQVFLGELAKVAAGVTPEVALHYRRATVQMLRNAVPITAPPDDDERLHRAKTHIAIALRSLAEVEAHLGELTDAATHLNEAERYAPPSDAVAQNILKARLAEVRAKMLLRHQPSDAVKEFTNAYDGAELTNYTFRATLLAERAEAQRNAGRDAAAERDLQQALAILAEEEAAIVKNDRGLGEPIWSAYFARFEDTYGQLIQQLVAEGRIEDAFHYAERARGFEPLQRILRLGQTPLAFKRIAAERRLSAIRRELPYGTFLLEYTVLKDRTITWIIWRDGIRHVVQDTTRGDVLRWTRELQGAAAHLAQDEFEARLVPPFDGLIARPLSVVRGLVPRDTTPRLVIVGDRVMQGLPMAALRSPEGRYLLQDAIVESQGSALLYIFSLMRNESMPADPTLLLVGDPQFAEQSTLAAGLRRLTAAKQEVHNIAAMHKGEAVVLSDADATIRNVLELARDSGIVHLALHGVVNARQPYRSVLLLAPTPGVDRGALEAQQLLRDAKLDRTRLVVLAACSSSGGAPVGPEGVGPLVRPILTAGVPAVLGTLWDVNDATARPVLVSFHRHFQMGSDAAKALREAQLELLGSDSALKRAVFWAPYQVIGHATSPYGVPQQTNKEKPP
jgi:tetratricopeptide (TPR) repeat protein